MRARRRMFAIVTSALAGAILLAVPAAHALDVKPLTKDLLTTKLPSDSLPSNAEGALEETSDLVDQLGSNLDSALAGGTSLSEGLGRAAKDPLAQSNDLGANVQGSMKEASKLGNLVGETAGSVVNGVDDVIGSLG